MAVAASPRRVANPSSSSPIASTPMSPSLSTSPVLDMGAASMLWSRRQNVACDGCKMRKIKCVRNGGDDLPCNFCQGRGVECTRYYVTMSTEAASKRTSLGLHKKRRRQATSTEELLPLFESNAAPRLQVRTPGPPLVEGMLVQLREADRASAWQTDLHRISRIIYKPVAVILDNEECPPVGIEYIKPYDPEASQPPTPTSVKFEPLDPLVSPSHRKHLSMHSAPASPSIESSYPQTFLPDSPTSPTFYQSNSFDSGIAPSPTSPYGPAPPYYRTSSSAHPSYSPTFTYLHAPFSQLSLDDAQRSPRVAAYEGFISASAQDYAGMQVTWPPGTSVHPLVMAENGRATGHEMPIHSTFV